MQMAISNRVKWAEKLIYRSRKRFRIKSNIHGSLEGTIWARSGIMSLDSFGGCMVVVDLERYHKMYQEEEIETSDYRIKKDQLEAK